MKVLFIGDIVGKIGRRIVKEKLNYPSKIAEYLNPMVMGAYIVFFGASLCSVLGYKKVPLSLGPILEATGYIWVAILGRIFLGEKIGAKKATGLLVIILGIVIASFGADIIGAIKSLV